MRILFVHTKADFHGGAERWVHQVARGMGLRHGFESHLAYTETSPRDAEPYRHAFHGARRVDRPGDWARLVAEVQPDLVCVNNLAVEHLQEVSQANVPTVRVVHDHALCCLSGKRLYTWSGRVCERRLGYGCWACLGFVGRRDGGWQRNRLADRRRALELTRRLSGIVVLSRYMRGELIRAGIQGDQIRVIPPGVDEPASAAVFDDYVWKDALQRATRRVGCAHPCRDRRSVSTTRRQDGNPTSVGKAHPTTSPSFEVRHSSIGTSVRLLFAGQVIRGKGLDLLLRAIAATPSDCQLTVAGTGNALEANRALARRLNLDDRVEFLGWVPPERISTCYREADVVVVPSRWPEPFGLVGVEAMSHAHGVVAFDVGGIGDWLEHGVTGLLVPPADVEALAAALHQLITDPQLRQQMGRAGRAAYLERFTTERMIDRLTEYFEQVVAENPPRLPRFREPVIASAST